MLEACLSKDPAARPTAQAAQQMLIGGAPPTAVSGSGSEGSVRLARRWIPITAGAVATAVLIGGTAWAVYNATRPGPERDTSFAASQETTGPAPARPTATDEPGRSQVDKDRSGGKGSRTPPGPGPTADPTGPDPEPSGWSPPKPPPPPPEERNPYSAEQACGPGYRHQRSRAFDGGRTYLLYSNATRKNCVVTMKTRDVGEATKVWARLEAKGMDPVRDGGAFKYYAGPVYIKAPGICVRFSGGNAVSSASAGWDNCG